MTRRIKLKICGTETVQQPSGKVCTLRQAQRFAHGQLPTDLRRVGFRAKVIRGSQGWVVQVVR